MTDLRPLLERIDSTLAECDASTLPPLDTAPVDDQLVVDIALHPISQIVQFDRLPRWQRRLWRRIFLRRR